MDGLGRARAELYAAFAGFTLPDVISYCTYCDDEAYERALHAPLAELPDALIDKYVADAFHHTGGAREFMHFLPRALELFRAGQQSLSSVAVLSRCIEGARPASWPAAAKEAFQRYLVASFVADVEAGVDTLMETGYRESRFADHVALGAEIPRLVAEWPRTARGAIFLATLIWHEEPFGRLSAFGGSEPGDAQADPALAAFLRDGRALDLLRSALPELVPYDRADVEVAIAILEGLAPPA